MKKVIALTLLAAAVTVTSALGQGYLQLQSPANSQIWDGFTTPGAAARSSKVDVALFWAANGTANPFAIASTPTNGTSATLESYTVAQAWTALQGSTWAQALNSADSSAVIALTSTKGAINYNAGGSFGILNSTAGGTYELMEVSWSSAFASAIAAAAAGSAIGWSAPLSFTLTSTPSDPSVTSPNFNNFGTFVPGVSVVPEPGTMALAGLGGLSLLAFRRKK